MLEDFEKSESLRQEFIAPTILGSLLLSLGNPYLPSLSDIIDGMAFSVDVDE